MDLNSTSLNRSDSIRKSLRLNSARKGLAPAPPTTIGTTTTTSSPSSTFANSEFQNEIQINNEVVQLRRPTATISQPMPMERSTLLPKMTTSTIPSTRSERSALSLMVIDTNSNSSNSNIQQLQQQCKLQSELLGEDDDANVSFALGSIEKHINQVEESFKHLKNSETQASIDELQVELVRKSKRYMETENLLQPCSSEMASENDFQYLGCNDDLQADEDLKGGQEFQRNSDARSSMGASYMAGKMTAGPNVIQRSKIARTASDTKNTDVLAMRAIIKQKQQQQQQQQQQQSVLPVSAKQISQGQVVPSITTTTPNATKTAAEVETVVDGNLQSTITPTTSSSTFTTSGARRVSQRTREENLRHFEALLAAHKAAKTTTTTNAAAAGATTNQTNQTNAVNQVRRTPRPLMPTTNKIANVAPTTTAALPPTTASVIKPHIIAPPTQHWAPPLIVGRNTNSNINNNRMTTINNNNSNMSQVNKRQKKKNRKVFFITT